MGKRAGGTQTRWAFNIDRLIRERVSDKVTTPEELAAKAGMSQQSLSNLKRRKNPTIALLQKIADAFGVDVHVLLLPPEAPHVVLQFDPPPDHPGPHDLPIRTASEVRGVVINLLGELLASVGHTPGREEKDVTGQAANAGDRPPVRAFHHRNSG